MKPVTVAILLAAIFSASLMLATVAVLGNLSGAADDIRITDLEAGSLIPMFFGPTLWQQYPNVPHSLSSFFDLSALLFVGLSIPLVLVPLRLKLNVSWTISSFMSFALGFVPCLIGIIVLRSGPQTPSEVGSWLAFMIYGLLYAAAVSAVFAAVDLHGDRSVRFGYGNSKKPTNNPLHTEPRVTRFLKSIPVATVW